MSSADESRVAAKVNRSRRTLHSSTKNQSDRLVFPESPTCGGHLFCLDSKQGMRRIPRTTSRRRTAGWDGADALMWTNNMNSIENAVVLSAIAIYRPLPQGWVSEYNIF